MQEVGRAGRAGQLARCHLFLHSQDVHRLLSFLYAESLDLDQCLSLVKLVCENSDGARGDVAEVLGSDSRPRYVGFSAQRTPEKLDVKVHIGFCCFRSSMLF